MPKKGGLGQFAGLRTGLAKKRGWRFQGGLDTPIHTMMTKLFLSIFHKIPSAIFYSKIY